MAGSHRLTRYLNFPPYLRQPTVPPYLSMRWSGCMIDPRSRRNIRHLKTNHKDVLFIQATRFCLNLCPFIFSYTLSEGLEISTVCCLPYLAHPIIPYFTFQLIIVINFLPRTLVVLALIGLLALSLSVHLKACTIAHNLLQRRS